MRIDEFIICTYIICLHRGDEWCYSRHIMLYYVTLTSSTFFLKSIRSVLPPYRADEVNIILYTARRFKRKCERSRIKTTDRRQSAKRVCCRTDASCVGTRRYGYNCTSRRILIILFMRKKNDQNFSIYDAVDITSSPWTL